MTTEDLQNEPYVMCTEHDDGVATMTISIADDDYRFDVWKNDETALVEFQECLSWRGEVRVSEPDEDVYKELMISDEMTSFLEANDLERVKRASPQS